MAVWTNLHWSFVCGLLVLTCWAAGVVLEAAWRQRSLVKIWADPAVRRWCWLWELGLAATCLNPHGVFLVVHTIGFADRGPVQDLPALRLLQVLEPSGLGFVASLFALMLLLRSSRLRVPVVGGPADRGLQRRDRPGASAGVVVRRRIRIRSQSFDCRRGPARPANLGLDLAGG